MLVRLPHDDHAAKPAPVKGKKVATITSAEFYGIQTEPLRDIFSEI